MHDRKEYFIRPCVLLTFGEYGWCTKFVLNSILHADLHPQPAMRVASWPEVTIVCFTVGNDCAVNFCLGFGTDCPALAIKMPAANKQTPKCNISTCQLDVIHCISQKADCRLLHAGGISAGSTCRTSLHPSAHHSARQHCSPASGHAHHLPSTHSLTDAGSGPCESTSILW